MSRITQTPPPDDRPDDRTTAQRRPTDPGDDPVLRARQDDAGDMDLAVTPGDQPMGAEDDQENLNENDSESEDDSQGDAGYISRYFLGTLPAGTGDVARSLAASFTPEQQRQAAVDLFSFLQEEFGDLRDLNGDNRPFTALVAIPGTHRVRVIYGLGAGSAGIGQVSPLQDKLLALTGEGGGLLGPPQPMILPPALTRRRLLLNPLPEDVDRAFARENHRVEDAVLPARVIRHQEDLMGLAPIPPYLVYDGLDDDLEAGMVYERLMMSQHPSAMRSHALAFLRTCLVGQWRQSDAKHTATQGEFFSMLPREARLWATARFQQLFPTLPGAGQTEPHRTTTVPLPPQPTGTTPPTPPPGAPYQSAAGNQVFQLDADALKALLAQQKTAQPGTVTPAESSNGSPDGTFKVSEAEKSRMRRMCGLDEDAGDECFPKWFRDIFAKHLDDVARAQVIAEAVDQAWILEDAEVPLYPALIKTIIKRDWTASDLGKRAALVNAAKGLSPFALIDLSDDDVALMVEDDEDLYKATAVSAAEVKAARAKIRAKTPATAEEFMLMLKRFTNLLFALFSSQSPLYKQMYAVVKALREYSPNARAQLSHEVKTSILWIILLQARRFAQGKMTGQHACLGEFSNMVNQIQAKNCAAITHIEVPTDLLEGGKKRKPDSAKIPLDPGQRGSNPKPPKKQRVQQPHNTDLAAFFNKKRMADAGNPPLGRICAYCGITKEQLLPELPRTDCRQFLIMGSCMFGDRCKFNHCTATTAQAKTIMEKLQRFDKDPLGMAQGEIKPIKN